MKAQPIKGSLDDPWSRMMTASIAGDEGAYRRLLEDIGRSVRAMARGAFARAGVGDADVEDAVQETLLAIHLKRHTWDPEQPLENFEEFLAAPEAEDPHALSDARKLLETLAPRQRDIVTSISLDGQSIAATAKRLSMSEVAVRVALHRALKSLGAAWRRSVE